MKNQILFFTMTFLWQIGISQTYTCPSSNVNNPMTAVFGPVSCENDGSTDYLAVTLNVSNLNLCSGSVVLSNLPSDVSVDGISINPQTSYTFYEGLVSSYDLAIPSQNCEQVIYDLEINSLIDNGCSDCEFSQQILQVSRIIPTLGQWGLIALMLLSFIFGAISIKKRIVKNAVH